MKKAYTQCTIVDNENVTEEITAEPLSTELSGNTESQDEAEFRCPLCPKTYKLIKSVKVFRTTVRPNTDGRTPRIAKLAKQELKAL